METRTEAGNRIFAKVGLEEARTSIRMRIVPVAIGIATAIALVLLKEMGPEESEGVSIAVTWMVIVAVFGVTFFFARLGGNHMVVVNEWGMISIKESFNQAQISYLQWNEIKIVSPLKRGGLRVQRGLGAVDIPEGLAEMTAEGKLATEETAHFLLPLIVRHCPGVRVHKKLVDPLRERQPALFHQLAAQRRQGKYYLNPGQPGLVPRGGNPGGFR